MAGAAETARLVAELTLKDKLTPGVKTATASLGKLDTSLGRIGQSAKRGAAVAGKALLGVGAIAAVGIGAGIKSGIESLATLESAVASVDGAIEQAGLTGQVTGAQIATMANDIERNIGAAFDDKDIVQATTTLVRFGKVTEDNLQPAMEVMTDLATKTGSVESAATLLAKALADPEKAAGKLARTGVILTKAEQKQIAAFMKAGKIADAQKVILDSLAKTTAGAAAASQGPYARAMATLADVTEDAQRALAEGFLPVLQRVADWLSTSLADPKTMNDIRSMGRDLASAFDEAVTLAQKVPWGAIKDGLKTAAQWAGRLFDAFRSMPPEMQATIIALAGLNKLSGGAISGIVGELGKGLIKGVLGMTAGVINAKAGVVNVSGPTTPGGGGKNTPVPGPGGGTAKGGKPTTPQQIIRDAQGKGGNGFDGFSKKFLALLAGLGVVLKGDTPKSSTDLTRAIEELRAQIAQGKGNEMLPGGRETVSQALARLEGSTAKAPVAIKALQADQAQDQAEARAAIAEAASRTSMDIAVGAARTSGATMMGAGIVANAVRSSRPIVTTDVRVYVTASSVTKSVTTQTRYGAPAGSAGSGGHTPGRPGGGP